MGFNTGLTWKHNVMVARVVIILTIAMSKGIWWCLEQPKGSLLESHILFQKMLSLVGVSVSRVLCSLGHFGADSMKPVWVYSSDFLTVLQQFWSCKIVYVYIYNFIYIYTRTHTYIYIHIQDIPTSLRRCICGGSHNGGVPKKDGY